MSGGKVTLDRQVIILDCSVFLSRLVLLKVSL